MRFRVSLTRDFMKQRDRLSKADQKAVTEALTKLFRTPNEPGLHREPLVRAGYYSIRAGRSLRIGLRQNGNEYVAIAVGQHDDLYSQIDRITALPSETFGFDASDEVGQTPVEAAAAGLHPLACITDEDLRRHGASPKIIEALRRAASQDEVLDIVENDALHLLEFILTQVEATPGTPFELVDRLRVAERKVEELQAELETATEAPPNKEDAAAIEELKAEIRSYQELVDESADELQDARKKEQQVRKEKRRIEEQAERIREERDRSERIRQDPDEAWKPEYPAHASSFLEVAKFFHARLKEGLPPFEELAYPHPEATGSWGAVFSTSVASGRPTYGSKRKAVKLPRTNAIDAELLQRAWQTEEDAARRLRGHDLEGVVRVERVAPEDYPGFLVYQWIEGISLAEELGHRVLGCRDGVSLLAGVTETLQKLLERDLWFSDLHAGNIMLRPDERPVLIDPAACVPGRFGPPEWLRGGAKLPHERRDLTAFEQGQSFMLAHLLLQCICPASQLGALVPGHEPNDASGFSSLACMMQVTQIDDVEARSCAQLEERFQAAVERDRDVRAPDRLVELVRFALHDRPSQRPLLKDFAEVLRHSPT
jgi:mRNA-degrading endonuclease RelE of RelBE toxin-antitoxin system